MKLSVVLAVFNEEFTLGNCLQSVKGLADEIIVVDGASTDRTVAVAQKFGVKIIQTTNKPMFHTNKQMAIDAASGDWILQLDADEVVDPTLSKFINKIKCSNISALSAYWIKRKNFFLGRFLTKGGQFPDPVIRLFRRGKARLPQESVHEQMVVKGDVGWADGFLLHYNAPTFKRYITNSNRYTDLTAQELHHKCIRLSFISDVKYLIIKPMWTFFLLYFRHRGYVDGFPGFVFSLFSGLHHAIAYMKLADIYRYEAAN